MTSETQPVTVPKSASATGITKVAIVEDQRDIRDNGSIIFVPISLDGEFFGALV